MDDNPFIHFTANRYAYGLNLNGHKYVEDR